MARDLERDRPGPRGHGARRGAGVIIPRRAGRDRPRRRRRAARQRRPIALLPGHRQLSPATSTCRWRAWRRRSRSSSASTRARSTWHRRDPARARRGHERDVFVVVTGIGLDAKMIKTRTRSSRRRQLARLRRQDHPVAARLKPCTSPHDRRRPRRALTAHSVLVGNCGLLPGGILLMPEARLDDGMLDVAALRPPARSDGSRCGTRSCSRTGCLAAHSGRGSSTRLEERQGRRLPPGHERRSRWASEGSTDGEESGRSSRCGRGSSRDRCG